MPDGINDRALVEEEKDIQSSGDDKESAPGPQAGTTQPPRRQRPKMLPEITPELIKEHEAQLRASAGAAPRGHGVSNATDIESETFCHYICPCHHHQDDQGEPAAICGIPYYLFMILAALVAAVTAGTVLAVVYYQPNAPESPTSAPTMPPTSSIVFQSSEPTSP